MSDDSKLRAYLFTVEIDGIETARFQKCEGLEAETYVYEIEEGGLNHTTRKFRGRTRFPNLILEKGITENDSLFNWFKETCLENKKLERKNGSVVLKDTEGNEVKRWNFFRAFPCRWIGPKLVTNLGSDFAVERIEIAHEGIEVDNDLAEVSYGIATPVGKTWNDAQYVTSVWGKRNSFIVDNGEKTLSGHNGMDFAAPQGTRINAVKSGTVSKVENDEKNIHGYGKYIVITHEDGTRTLYAHQSKIIVYEGETVEAGEKIGEVGKTGKVTGPHLHLGYDGNKNGKFTNSEQLDDPAKLLYSDGN